MHNQSTKDIQNFESRKNEPISSYTTNEILVFRKSQIKSKEYFALEYQLTGTNKNVPLKTSIPKNVNKNSQYFF